MTPDDRMRDERNPTLVAALVIGICLAIGVIVWAGGWGFSNDQVASTNPAPHAGNTSPAVQAPMRSTTGSAH
jgi:cytoskeletal protein RodZ